MLVPRPISSMSTRLDAVALFRMLAASVISTMKVERPEARSSEAPMRVKMRSTGPMRALVALLLRGDHTLNALKAEKLESEASRLRTEIERKENRQAELKKELSELRREVKSIESDLEAAQAERGALEELLDPELLDSL